MKKILLVLLMIFLGHSAFAVYCWEERSSKYSHTSRMSDKLGASNIVKVSSYLTASSGIELHCTVQNPTGTSGDSRQTVCDKVQDITNVIFYGENFPDYSTSKTTTNSNPYTPAVSVSLAGVVKGNLFNYWNSYQFSDTNYEFTVGKVLNSFDNWPSGSTSGSTYQNYYNNKFEGRVISMTSPHYIHTFCTTVGGGGGGAAGASVNYIIKAD